MLFLHKDFPEFHINFSDFDINILFGTGTCSGIPVFKVAEYLMP